MQENTVYQLGILWPDGATSWGEPGEKYDDIKVEGYYRYERDELVATFRRRIRDAHADPTGLEEPVLVVRTITQTFGPAKPVA